MFCPQAIFSFVRTLYSWRGKTLFWQILVLLDYLFDLALAGTSWGPKQVYNTSKRLYNSRLLSFTLLLQLNSDGGTSSTEALGFFIIFVNLRHGQAYLQHGTELRS